MILCKSDAAKHWMFVLIEQDQEDAGCILVFFWGWLLLIIVLLLANPDVFVH